MEQRSSHNLFRPSDHDAFHSALRLIRKKLDVPFAFGGQADHNEVILSFFEGARTNGLKGLHVAPGAGLGGQVLQQAKPAGVHDYGTDSSITHEYDRPVLAEKVQSVISVPVTTQNGVRGLLYAGVRGTFTLGERATDLLIEIARQLAREIQIRDEVDRRMRLVLNERRDNCFTAVQGQEREELRALQSELRRLAHIVDNRELGNQIRFASDRLAKLGRAKGEQPDFTNGPSLSVRELDVLAAVALGCNNREIADRLSLTPETVKSYLRNATRKLGVNTRMEAVVAARRLGLLG